MTPFLNQPALMLETRCPSEWLTLSQKLTENKMPVVNSQMFVSVEHIRHSGKVHWRSCSTRYRTYCKTSRSRASVTAIIRLSNSIDSPTITPIRSD
jgi:hypothetical protein